ncbi:hypothetical protein GCM10019017_68950 [Streptomyces showdoensis]
MGNPAMSPQELPANQSDMGVPGLEFSQVMGLLPVPHGSASALASPAGGKKIAVRAAARANKAPLARRNRFCIAVPFTGSTGPGLPAGVGSGP